MSVFASVPIKKRFLYTLPNKYLNCLTAILSIIHGHVKMTQLTLIDTLSLTYLLVVYCRLDHEIRLIPKYIQPFLAKFGGKIHGPYKLHTTCYAVLKPYATEICIIHIRSLHYEKESTKLV